MDFTRIPVSLKIDNEGEFYEFVTLLRKNQILSPKLVSLLKAYHQDEEVRNIVDKLEMEEDEYMLAISQQLERVKTAFNKSVTATNTVKATVQQAEVEVSTDNNPTVDERLANLERLLPSIDSKLSQLLSLPTPTNVEEVVKPLPQPVLSVVEEVYIEEDVALPLPAPISNPFPVAPVMDDVDEEEELEVATTAPASFGKALKSMKKK